MIRRSATRSVAVSIVGRFGQGIVGREIAPPRSGSLAAHPEAGRIDEDVGGHDRRDPPVEDIDLEVPSSSIRQEVGIPDRPLDGRPVGDAAETSDDRAIVANRLAAVDREVVGVAD